ncbi:capsid maturation protease [Gordonia phage Clown]|uniref:Capsid maturation protease n=1 Tax=Gordonia phage Clown TaxID=2759393 RepID=A0A7L7SLF8_9CAUD|nr:virion structural protein [Gordonia phage Clown]QOC56018.1 capsid maturation protease [Gordonia phage Clown]
MADTLTAALTASGIVYELSDFSDPQLDGPTALQVSDDGRVRGHLAIWDTPHIGYADPVPPPHSSSSYAYFHQGVVRTSAGDLPVGKLTLGTGHAGPGGDAMAAAAHYDNTGSTVAVVRAGEDRHGIWLAGRIVPGTDDQQIDELRRSSVSGDWRDVTRQGQMELVAALAVNVPGFPIPRTEQLVAAGQPVGLVAAGIVHRRDPHSPVTYADLTSLVSAAVTDAQKAAERKKKAEEAFAAVKDEVDTDRRKKKADKTKKTAGTAVADLRKDRARNQMAGLLAAGVKSQVDDATGHMPAQLHRYWTSGKGLAKWATTPTPFRSLVTALKAEITDMTEDQINGLASNLYTDVFKHRPGKQRGDKGVGGPGK